MSQRTELLIYYRLYNQLEKTFYVTLPMIMPVSRSGVSDISACHFRTCGCLDELWIFRVGNFARAFRKDFFSCFAIFTCILTCKTHDLTDYQLTVGTFLPAIMTGFFLQSLSCEVIDKSKGFLNSSNNNYFPLFPPRSISIALFVFEVSTLIFSFHEFASCYFYHWQVFAGPTLASHCVSTKMPFKMVPEKVHALPFNRKPLSFPWLRKNLLVFLGSVFSWVSSMYILCHGIPSWIFSHSNESAHSNEAAPIHFLHCCWLTYFACT